MAATTSLFAQGHLQNLTGMHFYAHRERDLHRTLHGTYGVKQVLGAKHPETLDQLHDLAHTMSARGRTSEAEALFSAAWEGRKDSLGPEHPLTLKSLRELADVRKRCGRIHDSQEVLHSNSCHGYSTRHPITSRAHAASLRTLGKSLKAGVRLSPLEKTLSSSMSPGKSQSAGDLTYKTVRKYEAPINRSLSATALSITDSPSHRKGRRMDEETAEAVLYEFAVVLLKRYGDIDTAFKDFDINGNGTLSGSEFAHHFKDLFEGDATAVFKALDYDRKGDICIEEFKHMLRIYKHVRRRKRAETQSEFDATTTEPASPTVGGNSP